MIEFDLSELVKDCGPLTDTAAPKYHALEKMRELQELGLEWVAAQMRDKVLLAEKLECVAREKYPVITPAKIKAFLDRKAAQYNEELVKKYKGSQRHQSITNQALGTLSSNAINRAFDQMSNQILSSEFFGQSITIPSELFQTGSGVWISQPQTSTTALSSNTQLYALTQDFLSPAEDRISGFIWEEVPVKSYKAIPPDNALKALREARSKEIFDDFTIASVTKMKDPLLLGRLNTKEDRYFLAQWGDDIALDDVI